MNRRNDITTGIDWLTLLMYLFLVVAGWLNIYAAEYSDEHQNIFDLSQRFGKQFLWIIAAIVIAISVMTIDVRFFSYLAPVIYGFMLFLLLGVLVFGKEVNGARAWYSIGSVQIQPSEFAKFATTLMLARFLSEPGANAKQFRYILRSVGLIFLPPALIILQPDPGSVLIYASLILVLYREGLPTWILTSLFLVPALFIICLLYEPLTVLVILVILSVIVFWLFGKRKLKMTGRLLILVTGFSAIMFLINKFLYNGFSLYIMAIIVVSATIITIVIVSIARKSKNFTIPIVVLIVSFVYTSSVDFAFHRVLRDHHKHRINVMLGIEKDPRGYGYNLEQSKIAIGSGGFDGKGFLQGTQTKFKFVPEQSTDFIFCTVGEEWGFIGTSLIVIVFVSLLLRIVVIAERQRSRFARIYAYGILSIFFFHFIINISMTVGLFPVVGIPLPFLSYGGSSLWAFTLMLFVLLNLDAKRMQVLG